MLVGNCSWPMLPVALSWGYCSTTTMRRCSADDRTFSAWLICLIPSGPVALTFTAWLRAWITASSVDRSNSMAPFTAFTRLGIRSWRRLSWTSICLKAFSVWFLRETSPLYAPITQPTTITRTTRKMIEPMVTPFRRDSTLRVCRWEEFRERLAHGVGDRRVLGPEPRQGMGRLDVQLHAPAHRDPVPRARALGVARRVPRQPRRQRPSRLAAWRRALALERQPVRHRQRRAQDLCRAPLQHVTRLVVHLLDDGGQRRALHLPQLDPQQLEEVTVGVGRRRAAPLGRAHEALGHVEPDGALARLRPRGGVDRGDGGRVEHGSDERGQVAQVPRREVAILPQGVQRLAVRRSRHASAPPRARSSPIRNTPVSQSVTWRRLNGFRSTTHWCRSSQVRTSSASASPVMIAMRPSSAGQRCTIAR